MERLGGVPAWKARRGAPLAGLAMVMAMSGPVAARAAGDSAFGEYLSSECVTCHQRSGRSEGGIPSIVGWPEDQFVAVMRSYRAGERDNAVMRTIASKFGDEELAALAAYFGALKPP